MAPPKLKSVLKYFLGCLITEQPEKTKEKTSKGIINKGSFDFMKGKTFLYSKNYQTASQRANQQFEFSLYIVP